MQVVDFERLPLLQLTKSLITQTPIYFQFLVFKMSPQSRGGLLKSSMYTNINEMSGIIVPNCIKYHTFYFS